MKAKRLFLLGMILLLGGCSTVSQNEQKKQVDSTTHETETTRKESSTKEIETTTLETNTTESSKATSSDTSDSQIKQELWDKNKASQLETFVTQWGKTLGQEYKSYNPQNNVSLYGTPLPQAVINGNWKMAINEAPVTVQWSEDGTGQADFNLVAVYSDVETGEYLGQHVYFFGFQNGQPKVYLTQQNQGNENNYLYFNETQNQQLKQGFIDIVNGQTPQTPVVEEATQQSQQTETTTEQVKSYGEVLTDPHEKAEMIRDLYEGNQGFNRDILNSIPDQEIIDSFVGNVTNAQLAQSAMNLLEKYPNLK
ncbi:DUF4767 domain-containing protein [Enterococcus faecium]|uniref:DUF4767 domain-containing protein n=3 Tax=Enterococcus faecium TaxID=1352 RepID=A0A9X1GCR0_ENTFC|nr:MULTISPECIES: DUF4767 domain-containing protein [Enterococcus]EGP5485862.1 DUF4767 domain-containing protein [Enterococcus faecium]EGP5592843.1 DUF4767 domain-containing protein [Enterococcus faecium]EHB6399401.1 DUF4767 domain-containing protein [Enterococcus faecium]EMF0049137.1 DUF4767 domain-containing protein [Enterococcus hirae]MBO2993567.1 DUF4767 domain-containing protein [Enterococcus faecium]